MECLKFKNRVFSINLTVCLINKSFIFYLYNTHT